MEENYIKTSFKLNEDIAHSIKYHSKKFNIDKDTLVNAILQGFLYSASDLEDIINEHLKIAEIKGDAIELPVSYGLEFFAEYYKKFLDPILEKFECKGHFIPIKIDVDFEECKYYKLTFILIDGSPLYVDNFTLKKSGYEDYELTTHTYLEKYDEKQSRKYTTT